MRPPSSPPTSAPPSTVSVTGASLGLMAGVQRADVLMLVMTDAGESAALEGGLRIGAQGAFAAGPIGRDAEAGTDLALHAPILYHSRANGLLVGVDLAGTTLDRDDETTRALYGDARDFRTLLRGARPTPPRAMRFAGEVARTFRP